MTDRARWLARQGPDLRRLNLAGLNFLMGHREALRGLPCFLLRRCGLADVGLLCLGLPYLGLSLVGQVSLE
jgi:hypothetical protein